MKPFALELEFALNRHSRAVYLECDLGRSSGSAAIEELFPSRYVSCGIAEQNAMGVAAGLAIAGWRPIVHTFAVFATLRAAEQVRSAIAYQDLPVVICATKGGFEASRSGPTHHGLEDLGVMRMIPGMRVAAPAGWVAFRDCLNAALSTEQPTYLRVPTSDFDGESVTEEGTRLSYEVLLIVMASTIELGIKVRRMLAQDGVKVGIRVATYIKPIDPLVASSAARARLNVVIEEHSIIGGLGSAVLESLAEHGCPPLLRIGVKDEFTLHVGTRQEVIHAALGSPIDIVARVLSTLSSIP